MCFFFPEVPREDMRVCAFVCESICVRRKRVPLSEMIHVHVCKIIYVHLCEIVCVHTCVILSFYRFLLEFLGG